MRSREVRHQSVYSFLSVIGSGGGKKVHVCVYVRTLHLSVYCGDLVVTDPPYTFTHDKHVSRYGISVLTDNLTNQEYVLSLSPVSEERLGRPRCLWALWVRTNGPLGRSLRGDDCRFHALCLCP